MLRVPEGDSEIVYGCVCCRRERKKHTHTELIQTINKQFLCTKSNPAIVWPQLRSGNGGAANAVANTSQTISSPGRKASVFVIAVGAKFCF